MACVSKPMRMEDFSLSAGRHSPSIFITQTSHLPQQPPSTRNNQNPSRKHDNFWLFLCFHGPFPSQRRPSPFFRCAGLAAENSLYMFCYPKQKTAREWTSGGESNPEPGDRRWAVKHHDMPSTHSHLGLFSRIIIQKKMKWKFRFG